MEKRLELGPHQLAFMGAEEKFVGLFGGVGNGKTFVGCMKAIEASTAYPNNHFLVGRKTYPELRDSTREVFMGLLRELYPPEAYKFRSQDNTVTFWNGSVVSFRHLDAPEAILSMNLGGFYIDQAEEVDEDAFLTLSSRLRRAGVEKRQGYVTGNPAGHNWVYKLFGLSKSPVEGREPGEGGWCQCVYGLYRMITANTAMNSGNLPSSYVRDLRQQYSNEWYDRYVRGSWDAFEGQIFDINKIEGYDFGNRPEMLMVVTAVDPAISQEKEACNTAFVTLGVGVDGFVYDLETIAGKWTFLEQVRVMNRIMERWNPDHIGVEDVAYQRALFESFSSKWGTDRVHAMKADRDKFRRAKRVTPIVDMGCFRTNNNDLLAELTAFRPSQKGKERKDRVDALVHALTLVQMFGPIVERVSLPVVEVKKNSHDYHFESYLKSHRILQDRDDDVFILGDGEYY